MNDKIGRQLRQDGVEQCKRRKADYEWRSEMSGRKANDDSDECRPKCMLISERVGGKGEYCAAKSVVQRVGWTTNEKANAGAEQDERCAESGSLKTNGRIEFRQEMNVVIVVVMMTPNPNKANTNELCVLRRSQRDDSISAERPGQREQAIVTKAIWCRARQQKVSLRWTRAN